MTDTTLKRFDSPDEVREFPLGRMELVRLGPVTLGRATYQPGWKWSEHVGPGAGTDLCELEHVGLVLERTVAVAYEDGRVQELPAGTLFHVPAVPHDSWVVGEGQYVSLHFLNAEDYGA